MDLAALFGCAIPTGFGIIFKHVKKIKKKLNYKKSEILIINDNSQDKTFEKIYDIVEKVMIKRKNIHPNVDYPTGPTYHLMGFDTDFFTPIFVISRITGWSAHIMEQHAANKLIRPLASYKGNKHRKVLQLKITRL